MVKIDQVQIGWGDQDVVCVEIGVLDVFVVEVGYQGVYFFGQFGVDVGYGYVFGECFGVCNLVGDQIGVVLQFVLLIMYCYWFWYWQVEVVQCLQQVEFGKVVCM